MRDAANIEGESPRWFKSSRFRQLVVWVWRSGRTRGLGPCGDSSILSTLTNHLGPMYHVYKGIRTRK